MYSARSMLKKVPLKRLPLVWLLIISFLIQGPLPALVVCLEQNGDINIESEATFNDQHSIHEVSREGYGLSSEVALSKNPDHLYSCVDIPIYISNDEQQELLPSHVSFQQASILADTNFLFNLLYFKDRSLEGTTFQHLHQKNNALFSIRSVVLIV